MVLRPLLALPIPLTIALVMLGCGDAKKAPVSSASEAPVDPSKSDPTCTNATAAVVAERCEKGGEMSCCSHLIEGKVPEDPKELEDFGVACKGGHIKACDVVREATREFAWKLGIYRAACPRMGHAACRHAVFLAALADPGGIDADVKAQCDKEKEGITVGTMALACGEKASLAPLKPLLDACNGGTFAACKRIADIDGNAATMMQMSLRGFWGKRGVAEADVDAVLEGRVPPPASATLDTKSDATARVTGDKAVASAYGAALTKKKDELRACVALGDPKEDRRGTVKFDVLLGSTGDVVLSNGVDAKASPALVDCIRWVAQTASGDRAGRVKVDISFSR